MSPVATLAPARDLSADAVRATYQALRDTLPAPDAGAELWEAWFWRWNEARVAIAGEGSRRYFRECQDTRDEAAVAAWRHMREQVYPISEEGDGELRHAFLAAGCRAALEARLGKQLFVRLALDDAGFAAENVALQMEEMEHVSHYDQLMGRATVEVAGETLTMVQVQARLLDPDAGRRQAAWDAMGAWFSQNADAVHATFTTLVGLRDRQARTLGDANFVPLAYRRMGRTEYGPTEVEAFRAAVLAHVVPLTAELRARQARDLGTERVRAADMMYFPGSTLGTGVVPVDEQLDRAATLFARMDPHIAGHFARMRTEGLIDLENRPGKKPGAFAMGIEDEDRVAIFCNSTGAETDVSTLTHEMGHAIQSWESTWIKALDLRNPTMDAAEVHSFGMEYLSLKDIDAFFPAELAGKFRRLRLMSTIVRIPYMCAVDEFQHELYARPDHSPAEREAIWARLWERYLPGLDFDDCPAQRQYRWMRQPHLFSTPFYYIDYALAEVGAMQLWQLAQDDPAGAMAAYLKLCHMGGTEPLLAMLRAGGLRSPFDADALPPLMAAVRRELGL